MGAENDASFAADVCLPFLRKVQNADGGWGFHAEAESRAEPTCWALLALTSSDTAAESEAAGRGFGFLRAAQLPDGSWPSTSGEKTGCWVTSLACLVLRDDKESEKAAAAGLRWFCDDWPRDSSPWRRLLSRFSGQRHIFPINNSYRGWGWTPGTSSWVEPTSFALLALQCTAVDLLPAGAEKRRKLAIAMLCDRMSPGGGWNCGDPSVYGVAGEALFVPTVWALLALRPFSERPEVARSLAWLEGNVENIQGSGSLALARLCLETYGRPWPPGAPSLRQWHERSSLADSVQSAAWIHLAFSRRPDWLGPTSLEVVPR